MPRNPYCTKCSLSSLPGRRVCLWGQGPETAQVMLIGDAPDHSENSSGMPFANSRIRELLIDKCGMGRAYFTYLVKCMPAHAGRKRKKIKRAEGKACFPYLQEEAKFICPKVTVLFGADVVKHFYPDKEMNDLRGKFIPSKHFGLVTATYSPKYIFINRAYEELFIQDFARVIELLTTGTVVVKEFGTGVVVTDNEEEILSAFESSVRAGYVASDLETSGLDYWNPNFRLSHYGAAYAENCGVVFHPQRHPDLYRKFLQLKQVVHNATFEGGVWDRSTPIIGDTLIQGHLRNPFLPKKLEEQGKIYCGNVGWKGNEQTWDDWARRNAIDVDVTWRLYQSHQAVLTEKQKKLHEEVLLPASRIYADIQRRGLALDVSNEINLEIELTQEAHTLFAEAVAKYGWPQGGNLNSPEQVSHFVYKVLNLPVLFGAEVDEGRDFESTEARFMAELALIHPFPALVRQYRTLLKLRSNYVYKDESGDYCSFIRPKFSICGTVTGRPSSQDPPGQTFSRQKRVRRNYINRRGIFASGDVKQGELVLMGARYAKDPTMVEIYTKGGDVHSTTAITLCGSAGEEFRYKAKPVNFLLLYGGKWRMLQLAALVQYGIKFSDAEAQLYSDLWFKKYYGIREYHRNVLTKTLLTGMAESPLGRIWRLDKAFSRKKGEQESAWRDALNYPTQGTLADLTLIGLKILYDMDPESPTLTVHDQIVADIPLEGSVEFALEWKERWEQAMHEYYPHEVPMVVDMQVGRSLGELKNVRSMVTH